MKPTSPLISPTLLTRIAGVGIALVISVSGLFLIGQYELLPDILPVHFRRDGVANGWQYKTWARVLLPVFVQVALAGTLCAVGVLLLSRRHGAEDSASPDVQAAAAASESVTLIAFIWVAFQGYAAFALVRMWSAQRAGLGRWYSYVQGIGILLTIGVAIRAHIRLGRPSPRPFVAEHWRFGQLYRNPEDPALFVPTRDGRRWTLNFGRPVAALLLAVVLGIGIVGPTIILGLALR